MVTNAATSEARVLVTGGGTDGRAVGTTVEFMMGRGEFAVVAVADELVIDVTTATVGVLTFVAVEA
jgi:hypothetical protein